MMLVGSSRNLVRRVLSCFVAGIAVAHFDAGAQNLISNGSFELGASGPAGWSVSGPGSWENFGRDGGRSVSVVGSNWSTRSWYAPVMVPTNTAYWVRFWVAGSNSVSGYCFGGFSAASRDFSRPSMRWTEHAYAAWVPSAEPPQFRLSSWDGRGPVYFDDVEVLPLNAVYRRYGDYQLGSGETLKDGRYAFNAQFGSFGGNSSRAIYQANTAFNTYRWYFNAGSEVIYRHELAGQAFSNAQVTCTIQNSDPSPGARLLVEAGTDGSNWQPVGSLLQSGSGIFELPSTLLPAPVVFVRLRSTNASQSSLTGYAFSADVPDMTTEAVGETFYLGRLHPGDSVQLVDIQNTETGRVATLQMPNPSPAAKTYRLSALTTLGLSERERVVFAELPGETTNGVQLSLPTAGAGDNTVIITVRETATDAVLFQQIHRFNVNILEDDSFGELLPSPAQCPTWTCSGSYKVGRTRGLPLATNQSLQLSVARNEYEPFQLVLRPPSALSNVWVTIGDFISSTNPNLTISSTNVTIERVEYVTIRELDPGNFASVLGDHPDPLPPLTAPFTAPAGTNSPLWFTVYVPKHVPGGTYTNLITIQHDGGVFSVPVQLRVFDFGLTDVTHTRTAYGLVPQEQWHGFQWATPQQRADTWELYLKTLARHRMSPFHPQLHSPIYYQYDSGSGAFTHDFSAFDPAMERYLEEYNFNGFRDTFYCALPDIPGVTTYNGPRTAITSDYRQLYPKLMQPVMQHLRERGWMGVGYAHWIDEPVSSQTPMIRDGMAMIEETAPEHPRMLSTFYGPAPDLFGSVNLWVPHWDFDMYFHLVKPRQEAGDEMWFYACTSPKDPWPNNFIDQPGVSPRIRQWYAESWQFDGEAYWGVNYYLGMTNPWTQTMSRGGNTTIGFFNLGHGDGNLVYPPTREPPTNALVAAPIHSVRFETSRDGYEDREYFWLLKRLLSLRQPLLGANHPLVLEAEAARAEAMSVLTWPPTYPHETPRLEAARVRLAEAIEALDDGAPFIAKDPRSKVVVAGSSERLRVEAVGWPLPALQWQHAGTNIPGAVEAKLSLTSLTPAMAGDYRVIASNSSGSVTSAVGRLVVLVTNQPPVIIKHPDGLVRTNIDRAVFGVGVSSLTPVTYQWLRDGAVLAGATNTTLLFSNVNLGLAGFYSVVASNAYGSVTSAPALLDVQAPPGTVPPVFASQPTNQTVPVGQNVQLTVTASSAAPLYYQWSFNGTNLPSGTTNALSLTNVQPAQSGAYQVVVWNIAGASTSSVATLTVQVLPPAITSHPSNLTVAQGQNAQLLVTATGSSPLAYQWFFNGTNPLAGASSSTLLLTNVQPGQIGNYMARVTNSAGVATSLPALLQLSGMPNYTTEPPGLAALKQGATFGLSLAPDNRNREILASTNLVHWQFFYAATSSAAQIFVPVPTTNVPSRFFRMRVVP